MNSPMREPGEQRLPGAARAPDRIGGGGTGGSSARGRPLIALGGAVAVALLAAAGWAVLRGIFELGPGSLAVAFLGGWGIGVCVRRAGVSPLLARSSPLLAGALGFGGWLLSLVFTWLLAMAILPGSTRTWLERLEGTPFLDWLSPQFGLLELAGLVLWVGAALYTVLARRPQGT